MRALVLLILISFCPAAVSADQLHGRVVRIQDGDTLTLLTSNREEVRVRLAEIDCPERKQAWGTKARQALAEKVFQVSVRVAVVDVDRYERVVGRVFFDGRDINRELVSEGHAWVYRRYMTDRSLLDDEAAARSASRGLWGDSRPIPPWEYRRDNRAGSQRSASEQQSSGSFSCESKRYCGEMGSCAEARYYLNQCGLTRLDGDGDGVPCE